MRLSQGVALTGKRPALGSAALFQAESLTLLHAGKAFERAREGDTHRAEIRRLFEREVRNDGRTRESDLSVTVNAPGDLLPAPAMETPRDGRSHLPERNACCPRPSGPAGPGGKLGTQYQPSSGEVNMLTRITTALVATALLATAIASPALARSAPSGAQRAQQNSCATWHSNPPRSEWDCANSSN